MSVFREILDLVDLKDFRDHRANQVVKVLEETQDNQDYQYAKMNFILHYHYIVVIRDFLEKKGRKELLDQLDILSVKKYNMKVFTLCLINTGTSWT